MSKFSASTGVMGDEAERIRSLAQDLYKVNTDSMEEIVKTSEALKRSMGLSVGEIEKFQQSYMDFAKTTGQANDSVVEDVAKIGKAWGLTAEEMAGSLDMLKLSNEQFGGDISQIQSALQNVAPSAKALGLSFEETNGYLNLFTASGLDATAATTAFTAAAKQVESPAEFKKLLTDIQSIEDPTLRAQKAVELFGSRAGVSLANALDGSKDLDKFIVSMKDAEGTVNRASEAFDNNFNVQWALAKKQIGGLVQGIGDQLMPTINNLLSLVTDNMPAITATIEGAFSVIGAVIGTAINVIKWLIDTFKEFGKENNETWIAARDLIVSVFEFIKTVITTFVTIASALWERYGDNILQITTVIFNTIKNTIESVFGIIKGIFDFYTALFKGDWEGMGNALQSITDNFWKLIEGIFRGAIDLLVSILTLAISVFGDLGISIMNALYQAFQTVWGSITNWVLALLDVDQNLTV